MRIKDEIYNFLVKRGTDGATDEQIQTSLKISPDSERPARVQLVKDGWVVNSGLKRSVPNSHRKAIVWVAIKGRNHSIIDEPAVIPANECITCLKTGNICYGNLGIGPCYDCRPDEFDKWMG